MIFRQVLALVLVAVGGLSISAQEKPVGAEPSSYPMTIDELFGLIEKNSSSLRAEKTGVKFADQGVAAAKTDRLPDIQTSLSVAYNGNILMTDRDFANAHGYSSPHLGNSLAVEAQQVVYSGGAVSAAIRMAELGREQAETSVELTRQQLRFLALGQFLELAKLHNRREVYEQNILLTERLIADIREKAAQGMALRNDVTRYELQLEQLRLGLRRVDDQRKILNKQLMTTLKPSLREGNLPVGGDLKSPTQEMQILNPYQQEVEIVPVLSTGGRSLLPKAATTLNPSIAFPPTKVGTATFGSPEEGSKNSQTTENQELGLSVDADFKSASHESGISNPLQPNHPLSHLSRLSTLQAEQQERMARSELLPKVALVAGDNFSGPYIYDIPPLNKNINNWFIGVGIRYSLSSLYKGKRKVEQARTAVRRAEEQQRVTDEQVADDVHEAQTLYAQSFADLDTQRKSVELATQNYQVVSDRYQNQLVLITDMIDASNIKLNAELQEVDAQINTVYAYYRVRYAAGQL